MKLEIPICQYCGRKSRYIDSIEIYGRHFGFLYRCDPCDAHVGVHKDGKPKGTLAKADLRAYRQTVHEIFDPLWQGKTVFESRNDAYIWLSNKMSTTGVHIGELDIDQCKAAMYFINEEFRVTEPKGTVISKGGIIQILDNL